MVRTSRRFGVSHSLAVFCAGVSLVAVVLLLDGPISNLLARPIESGQFKAILRALRCWGEGTTLVILAAGIAVAQPRRWKQPVVFLFCALLCAGVVDLTKPLVGRLRPDEVAGQPDGIAWRAGADWNSSFPSGHTATAFAFARALSLAYPAVQPVCVLAASGTALSRMYEQRHYLSDCIAGGLIGWFLSGFLWRFLTSPARVHRHRIAFVLNCLRSLFRRATVAEKALRSRAL